jgi:hypothetical protein
MTDRVKQNTDSESFLYEMVIQEAMEGLILLIQSQ